MGYTVSRKRFYEICYLLTLGIPRLGPPDGRQVAVVMHDVEVGNGAVALLLPGLALHLFQGHPLGEGVNAQDLGGLQRRGKRRTGEEERYGRLWEEDR